VVGPKGDLYIGESKTVRRIDQSGIITTVAGNDERWGYFGDGGLAINAWFHGLQSITFGPDGNIYVADTYNNRIRRISQPNKWLNSGEYLVASSDGSEYYIFDHAGRHQRTLDAVTSIQLCAFAYDPAGRLASVEDSDGNITGIDRDGNGNLIAIIAPDGQRTVLTADANGYLAAVSNPAGGTHRMRYTEGGLLTSFENPNGAQTTFVYDELGQLRRDSNPLGGGWTLSRSESEKGFVSHMTSGEGRTTSYGVERLNKTQVLRTVSKPDGAVATRQVTTNPASISESATAADGTITEVIKAPDPRAGMEAPYVKSAAVTTPSGLKLSVSNTRIVALAEPGNPLSLTTLTETTTVNNRQSRLSYTQADRTLTSISPTGRQASVEVNDKGKPILSQSFDLEAANYGYDARGRLTSITDGQGPNARTFTLGYDAQGYLVVHAESNVINEDWE
jgi:YD repeat-containing protein